MNDIITSEFWLKIYNTFIEWVLTQLPAILITIVLFYVALKLSNKFVAKLKPYLINRKYIENSNVKAEAEKRIITLVTISLGSTKIVLWVVFIVIILSKIGIEVAPLIAGAGIVGLAVGFGSQELIRDIISGFFVLLENQIRIGDVAIINGTTGSVEKIELRTVTLRDMAGVVHIFQHGKINTLSNMTKEWSAAIFDIGVAYKENLSKVIDIMQDTANDLLEDEYFNSKIIELIEILGLDKFAESAVIIKARIKTLPGEQWNVKREYQRRLKDRFDQENIEIPFPHTTFYWGDNSAPAKISLSKS
ncbi:MAG: mechanosensitive ion channel family protein [Bacteroidales bacterium]|nr:mechanosensitive ion channel family protein [Bacteroidales bacterium]